MNMHDRHIIFPCESISHRCVNILISDYDVLSIIMFSISVDAHTGDGGRKLLRNVTWKLHRVNSRRLSSSIFKLERSLALKRAKFSENQWRTQKFFSGWGFQQIQLRTESRGSGGVVAPPSRRFWRQLQFGTRNFISYSKTFLIFGTLRLFMMTTNLFVIANVKNCEPLVVLEFYYLFSEHLGVLES